MGHPPLNRARGRAFGLALLLAFATGCTALGEARRLLREPGQKLLDLPDVVAQDYQCATRQLPFLEMEGQEINPDRVRPGAEFNHRFVYALCPRRATEVVTGTLRTRIRFRGRVIGQDREERFEVRPGRWAVDSFIRLPESAQEGIYALELEFDSRSVDFEQTATFGVDAPGE